MKVGAGGLRTVRRLAPVAAAAAALAAPPPAHAVPDCVPQPKATAIATGQGRLESIVSDERGRLFYTDLTSNRLLRLDRPGAEPVVVAEQMNRPGGLVFDTDGSLVVGFSGGALSGAPGNGGAGLFRVNPETGEKHVFASGFDQANGLVRGPDGAFYTSNNIGGGIVRVAPDGTWAPWAEVESPNGLVADTQNRHLFAAETFRPARITRIEFARPEAPSTFFTAPPEDSSAGLDGLTRDAADRLYAAANGAGQVWRVADGRACALARGLNLPSNLAFGGGGPGFSDRNLYVVTFGGQIVELADVAERPAGRRPSGSGPPGSGPSAAPRRRLRVTVRPARVVAGRRVRLRFRVTSGGRAVAGARVRLGRRSATTGRRGRARLVHRFRRPGRARVRAFRAGYESATRTIRVRRARRR
ncbi:MAG TPA: SMP-30/gluconolactonase/LRE family protein [Solirubrobacteraceae bacterium]|nr:SMP-30/gluconolactonase/LRE family protein [Solirubrobacteraceae bacterium]